MDSGTAKFGYEELDVWQLGMEVADDVYGLASKLPNEYRYGLVSQVRRSALSIPQNIAEGFARGNSYEYPLSTIQHPQSGTEKGVTTKWQVNSFYMMRMREER